MADSTGIQWTDATWNPIADARQMHPDWARALRDQCATAGAPFLFKQWGDPHAQGRRPRARRPHLRRTPAVTS